jgi:hypothetical protein
VSRLTLNLGLWTLLAFAGSAPAANPGHPCAEIPESDRRLACYDAAFGVPPVAQEEREERAEREFGLSEAERRERDPVRAAEETPDRIEANVRDLRYDDNGGRVVSLDNGQVWLITEKGMRGHIKVGDRVAVRKAALGTHMLVTAARVPLRARRVR